MPPCRPLRWTSSGPSCSTRPENPRRWHFVTLGRSRADLADPVVAGVADGDGAVAADGDGAERVALALQDEDGAVGGDRDGPGAGDRGGRGEAAIALVPAPARPGEGGDPSGRQVDDPDAMVADVGDEEPSPAVEGHVVG